MEQRTTKPNRNRTVSRIIGGAILLIGAGLFGVLLYFGVTYFGYRPIVVWEYGEGIPEISEFAPNKAASYVEPPAQKPEKGWHTVRIATEGRERTVWLYVRDTKAPVASGVSKTISTRAVLEPTDLVTHLSDADKVWVDFAERPPFGTVGTYPVAIRIEDVSGNETVVSSELTICVALADGVTIEAGEDAPPVRAFLSDAYTPEAMTEITEAMLHTPGTYPLSVTVEGVSYETKLTVVDTAAPVVKTKTVFQKPGTAVSPEDFLASVSDGSATTAVFLTAPDESLREFQQVAIRVTDAAGNATDVTAGLLYTHAQPVVIEARSSALTAEECLEGVDYTAAFLVKEFVPNAIGLYAVSLHVDDTPEIALVEVRDTVPPVIQAGTVNWYIDHPLEATGLCRVSDETQTSVSITSTVDWTKLGEQTVSLRAVDEGGNETTASVRLVLNEDHEAPVLYGIKPRYFYLDEAISYLEGVAAIDNADGEIAVTVDTSGVDPTRRGNYTVTYSAVDAAGNAASKRTTITIKKSTTNSSKLDSYVREVTGRIFKEGMTLGEKVIAIYDYVYTHVVYTAKSDKTDWRKEALRGFRYGKGDCFTSNSVARALLEATEAEVFSMQRKSFNTNHYWLLVNVGTGWYHFDATNSREHGYKCRMWTDEQCSVMGRFWGYEEAVCPPVAKEPFDLAAAAKVEAEWIASHGTGTENNE